MRAYLRWWWRMVCLQTRYLLRDPWTLDENHRLADEIDRHYEAHP